MARKKREDKEYQTQLALLEWAHGPQGNITPQLKDLYPNVTGQYRPGQRPEAGLKYAKGIPDLVLPISVQVLDHAIYYNGLYLELKEGKNTETADQESWRKRLVNNGYCSIVAWGFEEAKLAFMSYPEGCIIYDGDDGNRQHFFIQDTDYVWRVFEKSMIHEDLGR